MYTFNKYIYKRSDKYFSKKKTLKMMAEHGTNDFITIPSLPSILETLPSILEKWGRLPKMANFDDLEIEYDGEKKSHFPNSYRHVLFAKKRVQIGQIWPVWLHIYFTSGYRGFPPCTLSQHPDSRETGCSNVLSWLHTIYNPQLQLTI